MKIPENEPVEYKKKLSRGLRQSQRKVLSRDVKLEKIDQWLTKWRQMHYKQQQKKDNLVISV